LFYASEPRAEANAHAMNHWRQKAYEMFPELISRFGDADTPYLLWFELEAAFERAYDTTPRDDGLIRRIYQYSDWCCEKPRGETVCDDMLTCVAFCFYMHIPRHPAAREDMPRWWRADDLREPSIFQYHLSDEQFRELRSFLSRESHRYDSSLRASAKAKAKADKTKGGPSSKKNEQGG
jgi:hypothetical protein